MTAAEALRSVALAALDARLLLQHVLGVSHATLAAHPERVLDEQETARYAELARRRERGEPVAYLVGAREFYGRDFEVGPAVLIPRPETELLIDLALQRLRPGAHSRVLDLGTGSGNIALTLALERPGSAVTALDQSPAALAVAIANRSRLHAGSVELLCGDWFAPVGGQRFDLIVSNPPYVAEGDPHLGAGDLRFEPAAALSAGPDGLAAIRRIVAGAPDHLQPGGWLLFEHGHDQADACGRLLAQAGFVDRLTASDLAGIPRVSAGRRPGPAA